MPFEGCEEQITGPELSYYEHASVTGDLVMEDQVPLCLRQGSVRSKPQKRRAPPIPVLAQFDHSSTELQD